MDDVTGGPRLLLVGAGRVGTAVAALLQRADWHVAGVISRSPAAAERAAARFGSEVVTYRAAPEADLYLLAVPDAAIAEVATSLAPAVSERSLAVHLAGSLGTAPLAPLADAGAAVAALHPVQACPDVDTAIARLPGSAWGVTCDPALAARCNELIGALGGTPVHVGAAQRPLWHAAAVMTSNGIAALMAFGESLLASIGVADPVTVLGPLAAGTVANAREGGGGGATLTGPVVRGEAETLRRHLDALRTAAPDLVPGYRLAAQTILAAAARNGRLPAGTEDEIAAVVNR
ncbi:MAG: Rossmann-like and DUF2520 domain-containing protein [Actinomycetota bacterium]